MEPGTRLPADRLSPETTSGREGFLHPYHIEGGVAKATVRLRNLTTGDLSGNSVSSAAGEFSFSGLPAGSYVVEVVNAAGEIVGASAPIAVAAGAQVTGVVVAASAAAAAGVGGAATAGVASAGFFTSTAGIVALAAAGAAVAGVTVAASSKTASSSK